jgi:hypothetical protein
VKDMKVLIGIRIDLRWIKNRRCQGSINEIVGAITK